MLCGRSRSKTFLSSKTDILTLKQIGLQPKPLLQLEERDERERPGDVYQAPR